MYIYKYTYMGVYMYIYIYVFVVVVVVVVFFNIFAICYIFYGFLLLLSWALAIDPFLGPA